ncbi:hypothetical protein H0A61_00239 [Koleobacter methoxysyntrophicus]|uniref:PRD domain-containing protein n=2 Tax=Koleobacter methoxysyntrophicus TaxID=2751313 RepID=A0A8A0RJV7_9FIRM|nr:glycine-rich SFCGS family protein [Koleobacter methoxysyntrophicus]QSQ07920.1 hypothetical protein H0A61_00239 [Koleobacter methoxysyntrophicus]
MEILNRLKRKLDIKDGEFEEIVNEIKRIEGILKKENLILGEQSKIGMYSHMISFIKRLRDGEKAVDVEIGKEVLSQLEERAVNLASKIVEPIFERYSKPVSRTEVLLVAIHIQTALSNNERRDGMEGKGERVVVVIGDRLGKGQKVAKGVEAAGGKAVLIPGMAADMKVGDVMHEQDADIGLSFCGSGGAGALMAANKYGYKARHHLRSIDAGITALKEGARVLGFGFLDSEELGRRVVEEYRKIVKKG